MLSSPGPVICTRRSLAPGFTEKINGFLLLWQILFFAQLNVEWFGWMLANKCELQCYVHGDKFYVKTFVALSKIKWKLSQWLIATHFGIYSFQCLDFNKHAHCTHQAKYEICGRMTKLIYTIQTSCVDSTNRTDGWWLLTWIRSSIVWIIKRSIKDWHRWKQLMDKSSLFMQL